MTPVYLSIDIGALDPAYAPSVSHREPLGLSTRQVIDWIHAIDQPGDRWNDGEVQRPSQELTCRPREFASSPALGGR
jgi:Arginase family